MASIRRQGDRFEIRECLSTDRGPRQHPLARFRGSLTPEVLDTAERHAQRPFDRGRVMRRARELGIPVVARRRFPEARALIAELRRGVPLDPRLVTLLRSALEPLPSAPLPSHLEAAADWIGQSDRERGEALRGLVRTADRILRSRGRVRLRPREVFPRIDSHGSEPS